MKNKIIVLFFGLAIFLGATLTVKAQENTGRLDLTVSPPVIELTAKPGQSVTEQFRVRNNTNEPINLQISVRRLISDPTDGNPIPEDEAKGEELSWVSFDRPEFTAPPLEWQDVKFTIDIPDDASYGYYYVFRISPKGQQTVNTTGAQVKGELLVVTLLNVLKDGASSKTELVSFNANKSVNEYLPVDFTVNLANRGNVHVKPRGNIFITRNGGKEISILEVNEGVGSILPGGQREFASSWNDGFLVQEPVMENGNVKLDENGNTVTELKIYWNKLTDFRIGPYTARLLMVYDDGTRDVTIEGATTFWVIPYTALAVIIVAVIIAIIIIRFLLKWYVKQAIKKSRK